GLRHGPLAEQRAELATRDTWGAVNRGQAGALLSLTQQLPAEGLADDLRLRVYLARGELGTLLSERAVAQAAYEAGFALLAALPEDAGRRAHQARICRGMGELLQSEAPRQALAWVERGLEMLGDSEPFAAALLRQRAGAVLIGVGENETARAMLERALAELPPEAGAQRADTLTNLATIAWLQGETGRGEACASEALALYERAGQRWKMVTIWQNLGLGKQYAGDWSGAALEYARALEEAVRLGGIVRQAELALCLGMLAINQGADAAARAHLDSCVALARQHQLHEQLSLGLSSLADLHLREGSWQAAETALGEAATLAASLDLRYQLSEIARERAELLLARGESATGLAAAEAACEHAREQGNPREEGMGLRALGQALLAGGRPEQASSAFARSVELLDDQDPYEAARTRSAWGAARADATGDELLRAAGATFAQLGARRDLEATLELLRQRGGDYEREIRSLGHLPASDRHGDADEPADPGAGAAGADV
ncbi:MAG: hypothetical protein HGA45_42855, partial [Chloroflexales bacterium]|nr:hypothetical protein [Chloroflexales bacterium]